MEQWNSDSGAGWWISGTVLVEQCWWNSACRTVRWNSGTVEQCGGILEQCWWNCGTVEQCLWKSVMEQCWWNSGTVKVEQCGGTMK